jgi:hypothetical protein
LDNETGIFHIAHTFQQAGKYKMWIDVKPKGATQVLTAFPFNVEGQPVQSPAAIVPDTTFMKKVVIADGHSYQVTLDFQSKPLIARSSVKMSFEIRDAVNKPISITEPLMALLEVIVLLLTQIVMNCFIFVLLKKLVVMMMMMLPTGYLLDSQAGEAAHLFPLWQIFQNRGYTERGGNSSMKEDCS